VSARSSAVRPRLRRLTVVLGGLGALGVVAGWAAPDILWRKGGEWISSWTDYVVLAIPGVLPFVLIMLGRPRRPLVSLMTCLVLIGANLYSFLALFASDSSTRGLYALGAVLYSWVVWGTGMVVDNWRRRPAPAGPPRRPDRH